MSCSKSRLTLCPPTSYHSPHSLQWGTSVSKASDVSSRLPSTALGCQSGYVRPQYLNIALSSYKRMFKILFSQACADKLSLEMEEFGFPPVFPTEGGRESDHEEERSFSDPTKRVKKVGMALR